MSDEKLGLCFWCKKEFPGLKAVDICAGCKLECPKCGRPVTTQLKWEKKENMAITYCEPCVRWVDYHPIPTQK